MIRKAIAAISIMSTLAAASAEKQPGPSPFAGVFRVRLSSSASPATIVALWVDRTFIASDPLAFIASVAQAFASAPALRVSMHQSDLFCVVSIEGDCITGWERK